MFNTNIVTLIIRIFKVEHWNRFRLFDLNNTNQVYLLWALILAIHVEHKSDTKLKLWGFNKVVLQIVEYSLSIRIHISESNELPEICSRSGSSVSVTTPRRWGLISCCPINHIRSRWNLWDHRNLTGTIIQPGLYCAITVRYTVPEADAVAARGTMQ